MFFKRIGKIRGRLNPNESPWQKLLRFLAVGVAFGAMAMGFMQSADDQKQLLQQDASVVLDDTDVLPEKTIEQLDRYAQRFREKYGIPIAIVVRSTSFPMLFSPPEGSVFLGICPAEKQVIFAVPPVIEGALGHDFLDDLRGRHFAPYFDKGAWPEGLACALNKITEKFEMLLPRPAEGKT